MKKAIRGRYLSYRDNPFTKPIKDCLQYEEDGLIVMDEGHITAIGPANDLLPTLDEKVSVTRYEDALIFPGFIDCHVHYPQTEIIGAFGMQLIDWLNNYTFVAEQKFADKEYARAASDVFLREILRAGTTTATVFCTVHPQSVDAFFEQSAKINMRNIAGKVLMDRHAPSALTDTAQSGYDQTKSLIEKWHGAGRALYAVTPRFAPTSTEEQMEMTGAVWKEHPGTYLQSHISENKAEIEWVRKLYPTQKSYVDVYDHYGQLGPRAIYGHGVHFTEEDFRIFSETGTAIAHCPTSNLFLGSGLFKLERAMTGSTSILTGLATDLGGGTNFSQLVSMNEAYKIAQLNGFALDAYKAFYLTTRGAATALYLEDRIGSIEPGYEADITILDLKATPLLAYRLNYAENLEETLFALITLGDDRAVQATYIAGECVYNRDRETGEEQFYGL
ncbi:guanine deaminase [Sneathiella litorea]|uniref:Guanine deaminase n=1 Tax=Sneathiella litorea TaxID=2606216 RepID=A0A6L8W4E8_9PROT|nr:guanine deaminase [Sneathiella litorea]MZR29393.1 guanine deaminase [Sneathiella litorea]